MSAKVFVITDTALIELVENNDIDGFKTYLSEDEYLTFGESVEFAMEQEALAFCAGLGHGKMEGAPVEQLPLRSFEEYDQPFIKAIESY